MSTANLRTRDCLVVAVSAIGMLVSGCAKPSAVNIALRKENQSLRERVETYDRQRAAMQQDEKLAEGNGPTTLPAAVLGNLFTTHGIQIGRLSGPADIVANEAGDKAKDGAKDGAKNGAPTEGKVGGLKVYVVPIDAQGDSLKAAGTLEVEAFDLSAEHPRIGRWSFDLQQTRDRWRGGFMLYTYVLDLPWQEKASGEQITLKVTFVDALTGRTFTAERNVPATRQK